VGGRAARECFVSRERRKADTHAPMQMMHDCSTRAMSLSVRPAGGTCDTWLWEGWWWGGRRGCKSTSDVAAEVLAELALLCHAATMGWWWGGRRGCKSACDFAMGTCSDDQQDRLPQKGTRAWNLRDSGLSSSVLLGAVAE
jgi:hypothetical protein